MPETFGMNCYREIIGPVSAESQPEISFHHFGTTTPIEDRLGESD